MVGHLEDKHTLVNKGKAMSTQNAFQEGRLAYSNGFDILRNPYTDKSISHATAWADGWNEAQNYRESLDLIHKKKRNLVVLRDDIKYRNSALFDWAFGLMIIANIASVSYFIFQKEKDLSLLFLFGLTSPVWLYSTLSDTKNLTTYKLSIFKGVRTYIKIFSILLGIALVCLGILLLYGGLSALSEALNDLKSIGFIIIILLIIIIVQLSHERD